MRLTIVLLAAPLAVACGGGEAPQDAGRRSDASASACESDEACSDGRFCTGVERCEPGAAAADARGCVRGPAPCSGSERCDERRRACVSIDCAARPDGDGDGHANVACGGDDCDDADPNRYPGNVEVCDVLDHDEDCDPHTFGFRDADDDGYADARCCNADDAGARVCGADCDDMHRGIHPGEAEVCNGVDEDCDGEIDEEVTTLVWPDRDLDGYGDAAASPVRACYPRLGESDRGDDCDDSSASVHPGAPERCTEPARDEDCDGVASPPSLCACTGTASRPCAAPGVCAGGVERCFEGRWSACSIGGSVESCDGVDQDCDGAIDEGLTLRCFDDADDDGFAAAGAALRSPCWAAGRDARGGCPEGTTDREPSSPASIDCDDARPDVHPGAEERCDGSVDEDCDGRVDEDVARVSCYLDADRDGFAAAGAPPQLRCPPPDSECPFDTTPLAPTDAATIDCDDTSAFASPSNAEACNGRDDDCDGEIDEGLPLVARFRDEDGDGYGRLAVMACDGAPRTSARGGDCNDANASAHPGQLTYLGHPHCPPGEPCTHDWNCDGVEERRPALACTPYLMCEELGCGAEYGFVYAGSEACGTPAQRAFCNCLLRSCRPMGRFTSDPDDPEGVTLVPITAPAECR